MVSGGIGDKFSDAEQSKVRNYERIICENCRQTWKLNIENTWCTTGGRSSVQKLRQKKKINVASEGQIFRPPTTIAGEV
jgi:hypothetical protein